MNIINNNLNKKIIAQKIRQQDNEALKDFFEWIAIKWNETDATVIKNLKMLIRSFNKTDQKILLNCAKTISNRNTRKEICDIINNAESN